ncbi:uncharacterized protein [Clytia hemisphaerica]|uniref:Uncharacterized protein n=1 Tax=Clytia hemisphaerica TaxID=252671 RepID=A0A7M6DR30_9CNID
MEIKIEPKLDLNYIKSYLGILKIVEFYGIIHVVWAFLLLIAGAVIADAAAALKKICDAFGIQCTVAKLEAAAAFGIITSFIFLGDGILHIYQHKKPKTTSSISATENGDAVKPSPPPNQTSNSEEIKS